MAKVGAESKSKFEAQNIFAMEDTPLRSMSIGRILLASKNSQVFNLCKQSALESGLEFKRVKDGRACLLEALRGKELGEPYDLIVLSVSLPVLDGFSTAMLLRENECARMVISVSEQENYRYETDSEEAGCDRHILVSELPGELKQILQNKKNNLSELLS